MNYLRRQAHSVEAASHLGHFLQGVLLPLGFGSVDGAVVEGLTGQVHHLMMQPRGYKVESKALYMVKS